MKEGGRGRRADERKKQIFPKFDIYVFDILVQTNEWLKVYFEE